MFATKPVCLCNASHLSPGRSEAQPFGREAGEMDQGVMALKWREGGSEECAEEVFVVLQHLACASTCKPENGCFLESV